MDEKFYFRNKEFSSEKAMLKYVYDNKEILPLKISMWWGLIPIMLGFISGSFLFFLFLISIMIISFGSIENRSKKKIENLSNDYLEYLKKEKKEKLKFEEGQKKKGLKKINGKWYSNKEYVELVKVDIKEKIKYLKKSTQSLSTQTHIQGREMKCLDCKYIWNVKKPNGKPAKCPSCDSRNINLTEIITNKKRIFELQNKLNK